MYSNGDLKKIKENKENIAILKNEKIYSLYEFSSEKIEGEFEIIKLNSEMGYRIYEKSLIIIMAEAVKQLFSNADFFVEHSLSNGIYCRVESEEIPFLKISHVKKIKNKMIELINEDLKFSIVKEKKEKIKTKLEKNGLPFKANIYSNLKTDEIICFNDSIYELNHFKTVPSSSYLEVFDLLFYPPGLVLQLPKKDNMKELAYFKESKKLFRIHQDYEHWTEIIDIKYIPSLNSKIRNDNYKEMILISEKMHERKIVDITEEILNGIKRSRVILISGPSASGKTTFSKRMSLHLKAAGYNPLSVSMDDYFFPRKETPKDENGDHDFESVEAVDIKKFNEDIMKLLEGEEIQLPRYDFVSGKRLKGDAVSIDRKDPIIIEGIHALNPKLSQYIPDNIKYKIYVSALTPLNMDKYNRVKTSDVRLIRRIVRDAQFRGHSALETLKLWEKVKKGEEINIFPFQEKADVMFNSALPYELAVLKDFGLRFLVQIGNDSKYGHKVKELKFLLNMFESIDPYYTPKSSIIREFIGNSIFDY